LPVGQKIQAQIDTIPSTHTPCHNRAHTDAVLDLIVTGGRHAALIVGLRQHRHLPRRRYAIDASGGPNRAEKIPSTYVLEI
jgi:hypothetical protein